MIKNLDEILERNQERLKVNLMEIDKVFDDLVSAIKKSKKEMENLKIDTDLISDLFDELETIKRKAIEDEIEAYVTYLNNELSDLL